MKARHRRAFCFCRDASRCRDKRHWRRACFCRNEKPVDKAALLVVSPDPANTITDRTVRCGFIERLPIDCALRPETLRLRRTIKHDSNAVTTFGRRAAPALVPTWSSRRATRRSAETRSLRFDPSSFSAMQSNPIDSKAALSRPPQSPLQHSCSIDVLPIVGVTLKKEQKKIRVDNHLST
jgi:hypothetical protein